MLFKICNEGVFFHSFFLLFLGCVYVHVCACFSEIVSRKVHFVGISSKKLFAYIDYLLLTFPLMIPLCIRLLLYLSIK